MSRSHFWTFQNTQSHPKVAQQDIDALTDLASGLLAFERAYLTTHGEKTPVFRLLSMINRFITEQNEIIERHLIEHPCNNRDEQESTDKIPF